MLKTAVVDNFEEWMESVVSVVALKSNLEFTSDLLKQPTYSSILQIATSVLQTFQITRPFLAAEAKSPLHPHSSMLYLPVANGVLFYNSLPKVARERSFSWNYGEKAESRKFLILSLWRQSIRSMILGAELFLRGQFVQSQHIVRQYIEGIRLLYLCVTDSQFLTDLINAPSSVDDFRKLWHKNLRPSQVLKRIAKNHQESPFRHFYTPFVIEEFFENGYKLATQYTHLNPRYLWDDALDTNEKWVEVGLDVVRFTDKMWIIVSLFELFSHSLYELVNATGAQGILDDSTSSEFHIFMNLLPTTMVTEGLYHLTGFHEFYSDYPDGEITLPNKQS